MPIELDGSTLRIVTKRDAGKGRFLCTHGNDCQVIDLDRNNVMKQTIWIAFFAAVLGATVGVFMAKDRAVSSVSAQQATPGLARTTAEASALDASKYTAEELSLIHI